MGVSACLVEGRRVHVHVFDILQCKVNVIAELDSAHVAHVTDLLVVKPVAGDSEETHQEIKNRGEEELKQISNNKTMKCGDRRCFQLTEFEITIWVEIRLR